MRKILFLFFIVNGVYAEPLFDNATGLKQLSTKYFEIIYSEASSNTVKRLIVYADKEYERISSLFGMKNIERLTVVITPDVEMINGMFNSMPYNIIILYDFLDNASLLPFDDYFYNLFLHELVHAISFNLRNDFWYFLRRVFGNYASPLSLQVPPAWMIEGVTVSMESADGDGRSNDPRSKSLLAQHMLEDKFQRIDQISQLRAYPKKANLHYIYGGLFNTYLQQKYGWEKYQKLWYNNNKLLVPFTFCFSFEGIYGKSVENIWLEFSLQYRITNVVYPEIKVLRKSIISSLETDGKNLYYSDIKKKKIYKISLDGKKNFSLIDQSGNFSVDRDNKLIYLNELSKPYKTQRSKIKVFDLNKKSFVKKEFEKLSKVDTSKDKMVAIEAERHFTSLVLFDKEGKKSILTGNEYIYFDNPLIIDNKIFFILIESNKRSIAVIDENKRMFLYNLPEHIWVEKIVKAQDKILFNFYLKDKISLSRLGIFDYLSNEVYLQKEDYFGGINSPVEIENDLYFLRKLTDYDELVYLREYKNKINFDKIPLEKFRFELGESRKIDLVLDSKNYNPFSYLTPQYFVPLIVPYSVGKDFVPLGIFYTSTTTPTFENSYSILFNFIDDPFTYNSKKSWQFVWNNSSLPLNFSFGIGGIHYEDTNEYNISFLLSRDFIFKSGKLVFSPFTEFNTIFNEKKYRNTISIGGDVSYNYLSKTPKYPYNFGIRGKIGYQLEDDVLYHDGHISYNSGLFFIAADYGLSIKEIYGVGKNTARWGREGFKIFYDESKLSKSFLAFDTGLFLRLDIDGTIGLFPLYLNYLGFSGGYSIIFTEKQYEYSFYGGFYLGTIAVYYVPFVPSIEVGYLPERKEWYYLFDLTLIY